MMRRLRKDSAVYKGGDVEKTQGSPRDLLKLLSYTRPYRVRLAIAFTSLLIASSIGLAFPTMVQKLMDAAFVERNSQKMNNLVVLTVCLFAVQAAFSFLRSYLLSYTGVRIASEVRG